MVKSSCCCFVLILGLFPLIGSAVAEVITTPVLVGGRGYITAAGVNNGPGAAADFRVGQGLLDDASSVTEFRNYFIVDVPGFMGQLVGARLLLEASPNAYVSPDPSETLTLFSLPPVFGFNAIGSGTVYGSRTVSATDSGSVIALTLNEAALAAIAPETTFQIGGALTSLNSTAGQFLFRFSEGNSALLEIVTATPTDPPAIPEPSTLLLVAGGMVACLLRGRQTTKRRVLSQRKDLHPVAPIPQ